MVYDNINHKGNDSILSHKNEVLGVPAPRTSFVITLMLLL